MTSSVEIAAGILIGAVIAMMVILFVAAFLGSSRDK